jgi:hypothetical protein
MLKELASACNICGIDGTVRLYNASGTNETILQTKVNYTEIGNYFNLDSAKLCTEQLSEQA